MGYVPSCMTQRNPQSHSHAIHHTHAALWGHRRIVRQLPWRPWCPGSPHRNHPPLANLSLRSSPTFRTCVQCWTQMLLAHPPPSPEPCLDTGSPTVNQVAQNDAQPSLRHVERGHLRRPGQLRDSHSGEQNGGPSRASQQNGYACLCHEQGDRTKLRNGHPSAFDVRGPEVHAPEAVEPDPVHGQVLLRAVRCAHGVGRRQVPVRLLLGPLGPHHPRRCRVRRDDRTYVERVEGEGKGGTGGGESGVGGSLGHASSSSIPPPCALWPRLPVLDSLLLANTLETNPSCIMSTVISHNLPPERTQHHTPPHTSPHHLPPYTLPRPAEPRVNPRVNSRTLFLWRGHRPHGERRHQVQGIGGRQTRHGVCQHTRHGCLPARGPDQVQEF